MSSIATLTAAPENLKHRINFLVQSEDSSQTFLDTSVNVSSLADKELILDYVAATPEDQAVIDSFPTIYDVIPLSLVNLKPVMKINGSAVSNGGTNLPSIPMGATQTFKIVFKEPQKKLAGLITEKISETVQKSTISGNAEGLALNNDRVVPPESRPAADTATASAVSNQKLYKTAQNFLYRLEASHDELARIFGARFTNAATRAIVFNGIDVNYQSGEPYSFSWQGLRIDASSLISYYSHFSQNPELHQKEFMYLFGLQASLDEADIFKDDYQVESISTVKGLKLINQGQIPGVTVKKIVLANESDLNSLSISDSTKTKLRDSIHQGHLVYIPTAQFTYQSWTGLVYIDIDPNTGFGGYIIGEGLNGGYTATDVNSWPEPLKNLFILGMRIGTIPITNLTATIISPAAGQQFTKGAIIPLEINYSGTLLVPLVPISWTEKENIDTSNWDAGSSHPVSSRYGTNISVNILLKYPTRLGAQYPQYNQIIIKYSDQYGIPPDLLKSLIHQKALKKFDEQLGQKTFDTRSYRYEAHKDYDWYSRQSPNIPPSLGWRGLGSHPEKHFAVRGHVLTGETIPPGDQVPSGYLYWSEHTAAGKLNTTDTIKDGDLTAAELVANNPRQGWPNRPNWNFTAQLVLAASYGLGQTLYETAVNRGFDTRVDNGQPAVTIEKLFEPEISINLTASFLASKYNGNWTDAVFEYNGGYDNPDPNIRDSVDYANEVIRRWNNGNGIYKEIN